MKRTRGISLIEVMVALVILATGVVAAMTGQVMAMRLTNTSRHSLLAMHLAEAQMETLQAMPAAAVKTLGSGADPDPLDPDPNDSNAMSFDRSWVVQVDTPETDTITPSSPSSTSAR